MRVLGIDPGLTRCGIGIVDSSGPQNLKMVGVGVIKTDPEAALEYRLLELEKDKQYEIKEYKQKRSLSQNAYCWTLINKIANIMKISKEELYGIFTKSSTPSNLIEPPLFMLNVGPLVNVPVPTLPVKLYHAVPDLGYDTILLASTANTRPSVTIGEPK